MTPGPEWRQFNIEFPDRRTAGLVAAHELFPALTAAQDAGHLHCWWYLRKQPWKLRYRPDDPTATIIPDLLDTLAGGGRILGWTSGIYEPETTAFGGEPAMDLAHRLFHEDSRFLLGRAAYSDPPPLGQRETTVLLVSAMLRAAGLDIYEQGDVWATVADLRPPGPRAVAPEHATRLSRAMRRLMTADVASLRPQATDSPLGGLDVGIAAFDRAGAALAGLARRGQLHRGLRAVLAHHIVFHANRAGLTTGDQATLAALARDAVFVTASGHPPPPRHHQPPPATMG